MINSLPSTWSQ